MERAAQASLTSCAWFFDDFGGLEGRVVLRWAARAVEMAAEFAAQHRDRAAGAAAPDPIQSPRDRRRRHAILEPQDARSTREGMIAMADTDQSRHRIDTSAKAASFRRAPSSAAQPTSRASPSTRRSTGAPNRTPKDSGANARKELCWFKPFDKVLEWKLPVRQVVRRRQDQRLLQLPRSPSDHRAAQQGGAHLGGRAGRRARPHLPDAGERGRRAAPTR